MSRRTPPPGGKRLSDAERRRRQWKKIMALRERKSDALLWAASYDAQRARERGGETMRRRALEDRPRWLDDIFEKAYVSLVAEGRYARIGRKRLRTRARLLLAKQKKPALSREVTERRTRAWLETRAQP